MNKNKNKLSIRKKSSKRPILVIAVIFLIILVVGVVSSQYLKTNSDNPEDSSINLNKPSDEQIDYGTDTKKQSINQDKINEKVVTGSDPIPAPKAIEGNDKKYAYSEFTSINQSASELNIRTLIQTVTSTGMCTLSMKGPQGQTVNFSSAVHPLPSSTTCKGFDIPLDKLSSGSWKITLNFNNENLMSTTTKEYTVR